MYIYNNNLLDIIKNNSLKTHKDRTIVDCFLDVVIRQPNKIALSFNDQSLTYLELLQKVLCLSNYLKSMEISIDECVGVYIEPSFHLMTSVWGILFSGAAYLPIASDYPEERIRYMIENSGTKLIISEEKLRKRLESFLPSQIRIITEVDLNKYANEHAERWQYPYLHDHPNALAYVIYTSGSTGQPKGVMIEHASILNQMQWLHTECNVNETSIILQKTPISFDAAQWEILAVCFGAQVIIGPLGIYRDPETLINLILDKDVNILQCVPTLLQALISIDKFKDCNTIQTIFCGGEILSKKLASELFKTLPAVQLTNLYGPTECTINASSYNIKKDSLNNLPNALPIGSPVSNTDFYILDSEQNVIGDQQVGELYIGGSQLARGYLNQPQLSHEKFIYLKVNELQTKKLYRTGDLVYRSEDGLFHFCGRVDNQIKLRGYRVELDEIKLAIENHTWVQQAAVMVRNDSRLGSQILVACIELDPREAALMDQGNHDEHHQSKASKLQVKMQLAMAGCKTYDEIKSKQIINLPGKSETAEQRARAFSRKTYRFYDGGTVDKKDILRCLKKFVIQSSHRNLNSVTVDELGIILRNFGQFISFERLLPKFAYASPGALYATQIYLEINNLNDIPNGFYYYHPINHQLVLLNSTQADSIASKIAITFVGKKSAIEPVYKNNIQEVLEFETGHILGLFDVVLAEHSLAVGKGIFKQEIKHQLECVEEDYYLGTFEIVTGESSDNNEYLDIYVQSHAAKVANLPYGLYKYENDNLRKISDDIIRKKHVIAINQSVYERASFGITLISKNPCSWLRYIDLGRKLQHLQMNESMIGFMSSGYSSKTGNDLPSAKQIQHILNAIGCETGPSYFCVGGRISQKQIIDEGMSEDLVHAKGPSEMLKDELSTLLPNYMIPNKIVIINKFPHTPNGKIDYKSLDKLLAIDSDNNSKNIIKPRTKTEEILLKIWEKCIKRQDISITDDFFEIGGNSLLAVSLITQINNSFHNKLPVQALFEAQTIDKLAAKIDGDIQKNASRIVKLSTLGKEFPIFCWPGLGGYPMNLRMLAKQVQVNRPFYGIQAHGINKDEEPYSSIIKIASEDIKLIKEIQPNGPYTLWGYSFGAKVAFETAYQLEQSGEEVENLLLIAPGSPRIAASNDMDYAFDFNFTNKEFVTILYSVFARTIKSQSLIECLRVVKNECDFVEYILSKYKHLDRELIKRIINVCKSYDFKYTQKDLMERTALKAPILILKAKGDNHSFVESLLSSSLSPAIYDLSVGHYSILKKSGISKLIEAIHQYYNSRQVCNINLNGDIMPHINIKYFPTNLTTEKRDELVSNLTKSIQDVFQCSANVISIALEPIEQNLWQERVYKPEIEDKWALLCKVPNY